MNSYLDIKNQVNQMYKDNIPTRDISKQTKVPLKTIEIWVKPERVKRLARKKDDVRSLLEKGLHQAAIAREVDMSQPALYKYIQKWGYRHLVLRNREAARKKTLLSEAAAVQKDMEEQQSVTAFLKKRRRDLLKEANSLVRRLGWDREIYLTVNRIVIDMKFLLNLKPELRVGSRYWNDMNDILFDVIENYLLSFLDWRQQGEFGGKLAIQILAPLKAITERNRRSGSPDYTEIAQHLSSCDSIIEQFRTVINQYDRLVAANNKKIHK